jgi:phosphatidylglycerophosphate synthase
VVALTLIESAAAVMVAYALRAHWRGRVYYERLTCQDDSPLLGRRLMEAGYWSLQPLARVLLACHVRPNTLSWASLASGIFAGVAIAYGHLGWAAAAVTLSGLLDVLDGMVARSTGVASDVGEVLDATVDRYVEFSFLAGLAVYVRDSASLLSLALVALLGSFMVSYSTAKAEALSVRLPPGSMRRPVRMLYLTAGAALSVVMNRWLDQFGLRPGRLGDPMVLAVALVAVTANISAVRRLWLVARAVRGRETHVTKLLPPSSTVAYVDESTGDGAADARMPGGRTRRRAAGWLDRRRPRRPPPTR